MKACVGSTGHRVKVSFTPWLLYPFGCGWTHGTHGLEGWVGPRVSLDMWIKAKSAAGVSHRQMVFLHMFVFCTIILYPCISGGLACVHFSDWRGLAQLVSFIRPMWLSIYRCMNTGIHVSWKMYCFLSHPSHASTHNIILFLFVV